MLLTPYLKPILGVALAASLAGNFIQHRTIESKNLTITIMENEIDDAEDLIDTQNERIDAVVEKRKADREAYTKDVAKAQREVAVARLEADRILSLPQPEPADRCEAAAAILRGVPR